MDHLNDGGFLIDFLIEPGTGEKLLFDQVSNTLISIKSGNKFSLIESVPRVILEESQNIMITEHVSIRPTDFCPLASGQEGPIAHHLR